MTNWLSNMGFTSKTLGAINIVLKQSFMVINWYCHILEVKECSNILYKSYMHILGTKISDIMYIHMLGFNCFQHQVHHHPLLHLRISIGLCISTISSPTRNIHSFFYFTVWLGITIIIVVLVEHEGIPTLECTPQGEDCLLLGSHLHG